MSTSDTIEQLEGELWGEAPAESTSLVADVHRLRRVPIESLSNDDLRLLLGQKVGTPWLIPLAVDRLDGDPLAGDAYPGDLLRAILHAGSDHWATHPDDLMRLWHIRESLEDLRNDIDKVMADPSWPRFG